jgi:hypothetical protein
MIAHFPIHYTLEDGTKVVVNKTGSDTYEFLLTTKEGEDSNFTFVDDGRDKDKFEESLPFDQMDALRAFWLKNENL